MNTGLNKMEIEDYLYLVLDNRNLIAIVLSVSNSD